MVLKLRPSDENREQGTMSEFINKGVRLLTPFSLNNFSPIYKKKSVSSQVFS